jgi:Ala-tRNA(Pro) deacylase
LAKTVIVKIAGEYALAVLSANDRIDVSAFSRLLKGKPVEIVPEEEIRELFPDCETGAMPPFGNLYDLPTYVSGDFSNVP